MYEYARFGLLPQIESKSQVAAAGFPKTLLSQAAACSTLEELERALRSEKGFLVAFTDVASFVDLHRILYQWEGQFVLSGPFADGEATARFTTPEAAREVRDLHAGKARVTCCLQLSVHMLEVSMSDIIADCVSPSAYQSAAYAQCQSPSRFVRLSTCWEVACAVSTGSTGPPAGTLRQRLGRRRPSSLRRHQWLPAATATTGRLPMLLGLASAAATATAGCRSSGGLRICPQPMAWALWGRLRGLSKGGSLMQGASMPVTLPLRSLPLQGQHGLLQSRRPCDNRWCCQCMVCQRTSLRNQNQVTSLPATSG